MSITDLAPGGLFPRGAPVPRSFGTRQRPPAPARPRPARRINWHPVRVQLAQLQSLWLARSQAVALSLRPSFQAVALSLKLSLQAVVLALKPRPREVRAREAAIRAILQSDFSATCVRLLAYLGALAVLALSAAEFFAAAPVAAPVAPAPRPQWIDEAKPFAAFALPMSELDASGYSYSVWHNVSGGGRRDIMRWGELDGWAPHLMVEVYRPGAEFTGFAAAAREIAMRTGGLVPAAAIKPAGRLDSKFGPVSLAEFTLRREPPRHCLGFVRPFQQPRLEIVGWYCSGSEAAARDQVACALDRLTLLAAGSEPSIGELFARADLKRNFCGQRSILFSPTPKLGPSAPPTASKPKLRGRLAAQ
jgi:hypothetical protein